MNKGKAFKLRSAIVQAADSLPVEIAIEVPELYMKWYSGEEFTLDINNEVPFIVRRYNDILYKLIQVHTTQDNWTPDVVPALWKLYTPEGVIAEWVQPLGSEDDYNIGDKVTHNGFTWQSTVANNVWEPGIYGWVKI